MAIDDSVEIRIQFDHIIDNLIDFYRKEYATASSYNDWYVIANELNRHQDNLRSVSISRVTLKRFIR